MSDKVVFERWRVTKWRRERLCETKLCVCERFFVTKPSVKDFVRVCVCVKCERVVCDKVVGHKIVCDKVALDAVVCNQVVCV